MGLIRLIKQAAIIGAAAYSIAWLGDRGGLAIDFTPAFFAREKVVEGYAPPSKVSIEEFLNSRNEKAPFLRYEGPPTLFLPICLGDKELWLGSAESAPSNPHNLEVLADACRSYR